MDMIASSIVEIDDEDVSLSMLWSTVVHSVVGDTNTGCVLNGLYYTLVTDSLRARNSNDVAFNSFTLTTSSGDKSAAIIHLRQIRRIDEDDFRTSLACTSSIRCIANNVDAVFDSVGNVASTVPVGVVVKRNQYGIEENPDATHDGDDHGKHHDDAEDFTHGILIFAVLRRRILTSPCSP